ncbi:MAG: flagellar FlbD family protein [Candidatus Hydrogenedentota bacterium]
MIEVSRLNGTKFWISPDQMEFMEATPDTVVSLVSGKKVLVKESPQELRELIIAFRKRCLERPDIK